MITSTALEYSCDKDYWFLCILAYRLFPQSHFLYAVHYYYFSISAVHLFRLALECLLKQSLEIISILMHETNNTVCQIPPTKNSCIQLHDPSVCLGTKNPVIHNTKYTSPLLSDINSNPFAAYLVHILSSFSYRQQLLRVTGIILKLPKPWLYFWGYQYPSHSIHSPAYQRWSSNSLHCQPFRTYLTWHLSTS